MSFDLRAFDWKNGRYRGYVKGFYLAVIPYISLLILTNFNNLINLLDYLTLQSVFYMLVVGSIGAVINEKVFRS